MATTTHTQVLKLPQGLSAYYDDLLEGLTQPIPAVWNEDAKFAEALQPEEIGRVLVRALHPELGDAEIGYLYREKIEKLGRIVYAQASRVSGKLAHYSRLNLLIEVNWERWRMLSDSRKVALIDHELCHFLRDEDDSGRTVYRLVPHDVEEFTAIARRWGKWTRELKMFATALESGDQQDLFAE